MGEINQSNGFPFSTGGVPVSTGMLDYISDIVIPLKQYFGVTNILLGAVFIGFVIGRKMFKKDDDSVKRGKRDIDNIDNINKSFNASCIKMFNESEDFVDKQSKTHDETIKKLRQESED